LAGVVRDQLDDEHAARQADAARASAEADRSRSRRSHRSTASSERRARERAFLKAGGPARCRWRWLPAC